MNKMYFALIYSALQKEREASGINTVETFTLLNRGKNLIEQLKESSQLSSHESEVTNKTIAFADKYKEVIEAFDPNLFALVEYLVESTKNNDPEYEFNLPDFTDADSLLSGISKRLIDISEDPEIFKHIFTQLNRDMEQIKPFIKEVIDLGFRATVFDNDIGFIAFLQTVGITSLQEFRDYKEKKYNEIIKLLNKMV